VIDIPTTAVEPSRRLQEFALAKSSNASWRNWRGAGGRYAIVTALFATCGAASAPLLSLPFHGRIPVVFPIPFAFLCGVLCLRRSRMVFVAVPLMICLWPVSFFASMALTMQPGLNPGSDVPGWAPFFTSGFIGGLGLTLCALICFPRLLSWTHVLIGSLIGSIGGLVFVPWFYRDFSPQDFFRPTLSLAIAVSIWQAAIGTFLCVSCTRSQRENCIVDQRAILPG